MARVNLAGKSPHPGRLIVLAVCIGCIFVCCQVAFGQISSLSTLRGTATDPQNNVVPGVAITLLETNTGIEHKTVTGPHGDYEIPYLPGGTYTLTAAITGFETFQIEKIVVDTSTVQRADVHLVVGQVRQTVTVTAGAPVINTESATIQGQIGEKLYDYTPLVQEGNSIYGLVMLAPAVTTNQSHSGPEFAGDILGNQTALAADGFFDANNTQTQSPELAREMSVVAVNAPAEYSRLGNMNYTTKSGSNRLHGRLYADLDNTTIVTTRVFFSGPGNSAGFQGQVYYGEVGGAIRKDKTFFFAGNELIHNVGAGILTGYTFAPATYRQGNFSNLSITIHNPVTKAVYAGNIIPTTAMSTLSLAVQNNYEPIPNLPLPGGLNPSGTPSLTNNFAPWFPQQQTPAWHPEGRIDHVFSDKHSIFGRWEDRYANVYEAINPLLPLSAATDSQDYNFTDTYTLTPHLVNMGRVAINKLVQQAGEFSHGHSIADGNTIVKAIGLQGVNPTGIAPAIGPQFSITGFSSIAPTNIGITGRSLDEDYADSLTWSVGRHVAKFGVEFKHFRNYANLPPAGVNGSFSFTGTLSGSAGSSAAYADFLLGYPATTTEITPILPRTQHANEIGWFVQDNFKLTSKLTLDYGLRWDFFTRDIYDDGLVYNWDPSTGKVIVPAAMASKVIPLWPSTIGIETGNPVPNPAMGNFRPRLGVSYRLTDHTVIRGGFGVYTATFGTFANVSSGAGPFYLQQTFTNGVNGTPLFNFPSPVPAAGVIGTVPSQSATGYPLNLVNGYIEQWNLTAEQEFHRVGFSLSYIGSLGRDLPFTQNIDKPQPSTTPFSTSLEPYPQFTSTSLEKLTGQSKYNALVFEAKRRVGDLVFDTNVNWNCTMYNFGNLENPYAPPTWSRSATDLPARWMWEMMYESPFGKGKRFLSNASRPLDTLVGGWHLVLIGYQEMGGFFSPTYTSTDQSHTVASNGGELPDLVGSWKLPARPLTPSLLQWFNPSAFAVPQAGHFGNSGVNIMRGPNYNDENMSVFKDFPLTERWKLQMGLLICNVLNHPSFNPPAANISVPATVGVITGTVGDGLERLGPRTYEIKAQLWF